MTGPATSPPGFTMSVVESLALTFDAVAYLSEGQTITGAAVSVVRRSDGSVVTLAADPVVEGSTIVQVVDGTGDLGTIGDYAITVTFTATPSSNVWAMELVLHLVS